MGRKWGKVFRKDGRNFFYLMINVTYFVYGYMALDIWLRIIWITRKNPAMTNSWAIFLEWKEGNVLFNDALNTFYLRLYGVRHMVKDHSDSERGNLLPPHGLLFMISIKGSFICIIPQTG